MDLTETTAELVKDYFFQQTNSVGPAYLNSRSYNKSGN